MPIPATGTGSYPSTTIAAEPYPKMSLSGAGNFTAEPQEMPLQQTSMPSVQLSLAANDQQQPPIRTQYAYVHGTTAPPQLTLPATADSSLSVPRYVDSNPRPSKSPRHANHQTVHSSGSITNNDASNEYRYGPPYVGVNSNSTEMSPQAQSQAAAYGPGTGSQEAGSNPPSATAAAHPPRDYFPSATSWTSTAGETSTPTYANGEPRPYAFPDQYKSGPGVKGDPPPHAYPGPRGSFDAMNHYSWSAT